MIRLILRIGIFIVTCSFFSTIHAVNFLDDSESSFAEKYKNLRILLQKITSAELAVTYKQEIDEEITRLRENQTTSPVDFKSLSTEQQKLFIKKFQKNRFHCGEVTAVAREKRRINLDPELDIILGESLDRIP